MIGSLREGAVAKRLRESASNTRDFLVFSVGSFRHAPRATFLPEEGFFAAPIITQIGRENKFSAEIYVCP